MSDNEQQQTEAQTPLDKLQLSLQSDDIVTAREVLNSLYPAEIAHLLESLPLEKREFIWQLVDSELQGEVLLEVNDDIRGRLIKDMDTSELIAVSENLEDIDDLADFVQDLPDPDIQLILQSMDDQDRQRLEAVLSYSDDTAGGLMNTDTITLRQDVSIDVVLRYLRRRGAIPAMTDSLIVVDSGNHYLGVVTLTDLLTREPQLKISEILRDGVEAIQAATPSNEVAKMFEQRDLVSAPVVNEEGVLLGRITIDDVVDVIRDEGDHSFMSMAGLNEEDDMFAPVFRSSKRRAMWLGINLLTALAAAFVIGLFDATIEKLVALAVLMPIVASMGGIAGSQTLTLVIRGMALGHITGNNAKRLLRKELMVSIINGILWAGVIAAVTIGWFGDARPGAIIAAAIMVNLFFAALSGALIPAILKKLGADPALGGGVVLTTVTDVVGFFTFLGLAALFLV